MSTTTEQSSQFEAELMKKLIWKLMPFLCLCFMAAMLDRVNVGFAKEQMQKELAMDPLVYATGASVFFVGYFAFEVPSNLILAKIGARTWIARIMVTWAIMRRMIYLDRVGLPNILAGVDVAPEFVQDKATPGALAEALLALSHDAAACRRQVEKFREIHLLLRQNTAQKAADAVLAVIDAGRA